MTESREQDSAGVSKSEIIRVILVEDDEDYREALTNDLSGRGFVVRGFADGASLLESLDAVLEADVIVLDWSLPRMSGIDLLPRLRQLGVNLPVVFLTGRDLITYEGLAFERGAVDYIDKVRGVEILVMRLRRAVKVTEPAADPQPDRRMVCGALLLRPDIGRAYWNEVDIGLTISEYNIVQLLVANVGRYVTYRAIYDCLHYEGFIAGSGDKGFQVNVRSVIKRIHNKFREHDTAFAEIENTTAVGYCWKTPEGASHDPTTSPQTL